MPGANGIVSAPISPGAITISVCSLLADMLAGDPIKVLFHAYPVTRVVVGGDAFEKLATQYARGHASKMESMDFFLMTFPSWLSSHAIGRKNPYFADISRCECLRLEAQRAVEAPMFDLSMLEAIEPEKRPSVRIKLNPATRFAWLSTPAMVFWLAHTNRLLGDVTLAWKAKGAMFCCQSQRILGHVINAAQHRLLCGIQLGETFGEAVAATEKVYPACNVHHCLAEIIECGAFTLPDNEQRRLLEASCR